MKPHTKIYFHFFGYKIPADAKCECCDAPAVDIHHINARQMGGDPQGDKDKIENLMAICREHHTEYGDIKDLKLMLQLIHLKYMKYNGLPSKIKQLPYSLDEAIKKAEMEVNNNVSPNYIDIN